MSIAECNSPIAQRIRNLIDEKGLRKEFIRKHTGFTNQELSDSLSDRLGVTPNDLFGIN